MQRRSRCPTPHHQAPTPRPPSASWAAFPTCRACRSPARSPPRSNDGLNEIISARPTEVVGGEDVYPDEQPWRVLENTGQKPDLLTVVDNGLGGRTTVAYRPAARLEIDRMPGVPWVVASIERDAHAEGGDVGVLERTTYDYSGGRFDHAARESLGFRHVIASRELIYPDGTTGELLEVDREFYQDEHTVASVVVPHTQRFPRNPLRGRVRTTTACGVGGAPTETRSTSTDYEVVAELGNNALNVRQTNQSSETCVAAGCASGRMATTTTWSDFDAFDNPATEITSVVRSGFADGFDGSDAMATIRTYQNDVGLWTIGLPTSVVVRRGIQTLSNRTFAYDRGQVVEATTMLAGAPTTCDHGVPQLIESKVLAPDGTIAEAYNNNNDVVDGIPPLTSFTYDPATHTLPQTVSHEYLGDGVVADLTRSYTHDLRFGEVRTTTDENGVVTRTDFDTFGRPVATYLGASQVSSTSYNDTTRPIERTTTLYPSDGESIVRKEYLDGFARPRQRNVLTAAGAIVEEWVSYDSFGVAAVAARPFELGSDAFVPSTALTAPVARARHDVFGRVTANELPDGRTTTAVYGVGSVEETNARGIPTARFFDAWGRVVAVDEFYAPATGGALTAQRTTYARDALGRVYQVVDAAGHVRDSTYTERGLLSTTTAAHRAGVSVESYVTCYDLVGRPIFASTPDGRSVATMYDEIGRPLSIAYSDGVDDTTFEYDSPTVPHGNGRLTRISNATGTLEIDEYDVLGGITASRAIVHADVPPWPAGITVESATQYDRLGRVVETTLPHTPGGAFIKDAIGITLEYDEAGRPVSLATTDGSLVQILGYTPEGRIAAASYANGVTEAWTHDPLNGRVVSSSVDGPSGLLLSYSLGYDDNDNPTAIQRHFGAPLITHEPVVSKWFAYDTLDRLESATFDGIESASISYQFGYGPTGNILLKDGFSYAYEGADPQAVTRRSIPGYEETFNYDLDGQLISSTTAAGTRDFVWSGAGRLATVLRGPEQVRFSYGPDGARWLKQSIDAYRFTTTDIYRA